MIFVNLTGDALPFEQFIAPLQERTAFLSPGALCHDAALKRCASPKANWKILVENFVESYHLPAVHRELQKVNPMAWHYQILGGASYVGQGGDGRDWQKSGSEDDLPATSQGGFKRFQSIEVFWLCPNLIFQPVGNLCAVMMLFPKSPEVTYERMEFFFYGAQAMGSKYAAERQRQVDFLVQINNEDVAICEQVQAGRRSIGMKGAYFVCGRRKAACGCNKLLPLRCSRTQSGPV